MISTTHGRAPDGVQVKLDVDRTHLAAVLADSIGESLQARPQVSQVPRRSPLVLLPLQVSGHDGDEGLRSSSRWFSVHASTASWMWLMEPVFSRAWARPSTATVRGMPNGLRSSRQAVSKAISSFRSVAAMESPSDNLRAMREASWRVSVSLAKSRKARFPEV
jgi:hypothetical protein